MSRTITSPYADSLESSGKLMSDTREFLSMIEVDLSMLRAQDNVLSKAVDPENEEPKIEGLLPPRPIPNEFLP